MFFQVRVQKQSLTGERRTDNRQDNVLKSKDFVVVVVASGAAAQGSIF